MGARRPPRSLARTTSRSYDASSAAALDRLLLRVHAAQTFGEIQAAYLGTIDDVIGARAHGVYWLDPETGRPVDVAALAPDAFLDEYEQYGRAGDPVLHQAVARRRPVDNTRILSEPEWRRAPVYQVLRRARFTHSMEAPVLLNGALVGTLNLARGVHDRPFSEDDLALLGEISRHVTIALQRAQRFEALNQRASLLEDTLNAVPQAVVISRLDGSTLFANRAAERLPRTAEPSRLLPGSSWIVRENVRALAEGAARIAMASSLHGDDDADREGSTRERSASGFLVKSVLLSRRHAAVVSFIYPRPSPGAPPVEWSPLSPREQEVVELVSRGLSTREIAEQAFITENTVKQHLKRIFRKLQVNSRAELIQVLWQVASASPSGRG